MKRVLITGAGSYIGEHIAAWLLRSPERFAVQTLDMRDETWRRFDFAGFDAVVHVAGIAHQRETEENRALYEQVNHRLAAETALQAKQAGVSQFVLFSSMSVYGLVVGRITADTKPAPNTAYGESKLAAENDLFALADDNFRVAALRPPMIYGKGCKGNYPRLSALVRRLPMLPRAKNERSMLYIDCLCGFVERLLLCGEGGLYFPQNREYVSTDALAACIAKQYGKRLWQPACFAWLLAALAKRGGTIGKLFGTLTYDRSMSEAFADLPQPTFEETIRATEERA